MRHLGTKVIETKRLILRPFVIEDTKAMYQNWASDKEVTKFLTWPEHQDEKVTKMILNEWLDNYKQDDYYQWAITFKDKPQEVIGSIGVNNKITEPIKLAHIGYCIGRTWWHQGVTSEALMGVIKFLFNEVGVNRIESRHDPRNVNSGAVMKKCGMHQEGILRQVDWNNQGVCDAVYYGLLKSEFIEME